MKALVISANGFEDMELFYPIYRLKEEGWDVTLASTNSGTIAGKHAYEARVDAIISKVDPKGYDLLVIPGGKGPEEVRLDGSALRIVKHFFDQNKPVAAICHGAQVLVSAEAVDGRKLTCWKGIRDDVIAAGGRYSDETVIVDGNLVTSRMPDDLPNFMRETLKLAAKLRGKVARAA